MTHPERLIRRPTRVDTVRDRMHVVPVATVSISVGARADAIHRALRANAEGQGGELEWAEVLERSGDLLVCDFWTELPLPGRLVIRFPTRESVELDPPHAVHYRHRGGPSRGLAETISIEPLGAGDVSRVVYRAVYPSPWRSWAALFALIARPVAVLFMRAHFNELRRTVERRHHRGGASADGPGDRA